MFDRISKEKELFKKFYEVLVPKAATAEQIKLRESQQKLQRQMEDFEEKMRNSEEKNKKADHAEHLAEGMVKQLEIHAKICKDRETNLQAAINNLAEKIQDNNNKEKKDENNIVNNVKKLINEMEIMKESVGKIKGPYEDNLNKMKIEIDLLHKEIQYQYETNADFDKIIKDLRDKIAKCQENQIIIQNTQNSDSAIFNASPSKPQISKNTDNLNSNSQINQENQKILTFEESSPQIGQKERRIAKTSLRIESLHLSKDGKKFRKKLECRLPRITVNTSLGIF